MALTPDDILTDLWAIYYAKNPNREESIVEDEDFDETLAELGLGEDGWEDV